MKYLAAYALLSLSGAADLKSVLGSANVNVSDDDLNRLIESLRGKDVNKLIAAGLTKIGSTGSAPAASKPAVQEKKKEEPKKEAPKKKEQPKEEEEEDMGLGGGLFD